MDVEEMRDAFIDMWDDAPGQLDLRMISTRPALPECRQTRHGRDGLRMGKVSYQTAFAGHAERLRAGPRPCRDVTARSWIRILAAANALEDFGLPTGVDEQARCEWADVDARYRCEDPKWCGQIQYMT
jgi:hypothetical protein